MSYHAVRMRAELADNGPVLILEQQHRGAWIELAREPLPKATAPLKDWGVTVEAQAVELRVYATVPRQARRA